MYTDCQQIPGVLVLFVSQVCTFLRCVLSFSIKDACDDVTPANPNDSAQLVSE
jgi:hypothetical protein